MAARDDDGGVAIPAWLEAFPSVRTLAILWATVDLDRALADLPPELRTAPRARPFGDPLLGALVVVVGADPPLAVAEPSTEGRLAATLARHGEGAVGRYAVAPAGLDEIARAAARVGAGVSRPALGPFGRSILVLTPLGGRHLILVDPAAVPSPP